MCGFVGTTNKHMCSLMLDKQAHRGPDAKQYWADNSYAFGHALLDITGSGQTQPYITENNNILLFNGEIYDSADQNDTAWLGKLLDKYGFNPLNEIDWHGAIAFFNRKENTITLCRDQFGTKPLWWKWDKKHFEFSTSLKSFQGKVAKPIDRKYIVNTQYFGSECMWENIHKVPPGGLITFDAKHRGKILSNRNLWNYYLKRNPKNPPDNWRPEFQKKTTEQVLKVINHGTNNRTALFLSGGLDSNLIAAIAKNSNKEVILYTCGYELQKGDIHSHDFFRDESSMALQTAKELGMPIVKVDLSRDDRTAYGKMWVSETHYLWSDHNRQAPRYAMCKQAAKDGCKVVITGDSGDELFTGYLHHAKRLERKWCEEHTRYLKESSWFPYKTLTNDLLWNTFFSDLLHTSEQNVLAIDQTAGMFGMEARVPLLTQRYAMYLWNNYPTKFIFQQDPSLTVGTTKYLARIGGKGIVPEHILNRTTKVGWSSPWDNNVENIAERWRLRDFELLKRIG